MFMECLKCDRHITKFKESNDQIVPRICSWANMYQGKKYDARLLLARMKDKEVCANNDRHVQPWRELPYGDISRYVLMQIVPVLDVTPTEKKLPAVQAFIRTEGYKMYVEDTEVCVTVT